MKSSPLATVSAVSTPVGAASTGCPIQEGALCFHAKAAAGLARIPSAHAPEPCRPAG